MELEQRISRDWRLEALDSLCALKARADELRRIRNDLFSLAEDIRWENRVGNLCVILGRRMRAEYDDDLREDSQTGVRLRLPLNKLTAWVRLALDDIEEELDQISRDAEARIVKATKDKENVAAS